MQVKFMQLLQKLFPETQILSVSESSGINDHIEMAPVIYDKQWYCHQDKPLDRTCNWYDLPEEMPSRMTGK